jgi:hypothetical protein
MKTKFFGAVKIGQTAKRKAKKEKVGGSYYSCLPLTCALIFKQSMGAMNRVGIGLSYRPARRNLFLGIDSWAP